jgi:signal transduction histidine kinase
VTCHPEGDRHLGVLLIDVSLTDARAYLTKDLHIDLAISGGFTLMVTAGVYFLMHLLVVRRVERFRQPLEAFASGDLAARLPSPRDPWDELDTLTSTFNHMATELEQQIEEQEQRHQLRQRAIVEERERIAREMHDGIAQLMGYVNTKAAAVRLLLMNDRLDEARSQLHQLAEAAEVSYIALRASILGLRISDHEGIGLAATLQEFTTNFSELTGIQVDVRLPPQEAEQFIPYESELHLLRITQEALSNIQKHSSSKQAWVELKLDDHLLELTIGDYGTGFNPEQPKTDLRPHFGLSTMRERAEAIGASFLVDAAPGKGTRITILLPLETN